MSSGQHSEVWSFVLSGSGASASACAEPYKRNLNLATDPELLARALSAQFGCEGAAVQLFAEHGAWHSFDSDDVVAARACHELLLASGCPKTAAAFATAAAQVTHSFAQPPPNVTTGKRVQTAAASTTTELSGADTERQKAAGVLSGALMGASACGRTRLVEALLAVGADPNNGVATGLTGRSCGSGAARGGVRPLAPTEACPEGNVSLVELVVEAGPTPDGRQGAAHQTQATSAPVAGAKPSPRFPGLGGAHRSGAADAPAIGVGIAGIGTGVAASRVTGTGAAAAAATVAAAAVAAPIKLPPALAAAVASAGAPTTAATLKRSGAKRRRSSSAGKPQPRSGRSGGGGDGSAGAATVEGTGAPGWSGPDSDADASDHGGDFSDADEPLPCHPAGPRAASARGLGLGLWPQLQARLGEPQPPLAFQPPRTPSPQSAQPSDLAVEPVIRPQPRLPPYSHGLSLPPGAPPPPMAPLPPRPCPRPQAALQPLPPFPLASSFLPPIAALPPLSLSRGAPPPPPLAGTSTPRQRPVVTPLLAACSAGHPEVVALLLRHGAAVDATHGSELLAAADPRVVDALLEGLAAPGLTAHLGAALVAAAGGGRAGVVAALLRHGADPLVGGGMALSEAAYQGHCLVLELLLAACGDRLSGPVPGSSSSSSVLEAARQLALRFGRIEAADMLARFRASASTTTARLARG